MKILKNAMKNLDIWDMGLTKLSVFFFTLWLVALIPDFTIWIISVRSWIFAVIWIILALRPLCRAFLKK